MMARFNSGGPEAHMLRMKAHLDEYENQFKKEPSKEDVQKAVQGACGKMDAENRITFGPLKNPELLLQWLRSIHFQGPILMMLTDNDLLKPKCWLGGGKSSGKNDLDLKFVLVRRSCDYISRTAASQIIIISKTLSIVRLQAHH